MAEAQPAKPLEGRKEAQLEVVVQGEFSENLSSRRQATALLLHDLPKKSEKSVSYVANGRCHLRGDINCLGGSEGKRIRKEEKKDETVRIVIVGCSVISFEANDQQN